MFVVKSDASERHSRHKYSKVKLKNLKNSKKLELPAKSVIESN